MAKTMVNARLTETAVESIRKFTTAIPGATATDALEAFVPIWLVIHAYIENTHGLANVDEPEAFRGWALELMADGARHRMLSDRFHPIAPYFLRTLTAEETLAYYADWCAAGRNIVIGKSGEFWLAQIPAEGEVWGEPKFQDRHGNPGWAVLRRNQKFTLGGIETAPDAGDNNNA